MADLHTKDLLSKEELDILLRGVMPDDDSSARDAEAKDEGEADCRPSGDAASERMSAYSEDAPDAAAQQDVRDDPEEPADSVNTGTVGSPEAALRLADPYAVRRLAAMLSDDLALRSCDFCSVLPVPDAPERLAKGRLADLFPEGGLFLLLASEPFGDRGLLFVERMPAAAIEEHLQDEDTPVTAFFSGISRCLALACMPARIHVRVLRAEYKRSALSAQTFSETLVAADMMLEAGTICGRLRLALPAPVWGLRED